MGFPQAALDPGQWDFPGAPTLSASFETRLIVLPILFGLGSQETSSVQ